MKTKQILFFIILFAGFIIFASMRPENSPNNYRNFGINDTIDTLKINTPISFDDLGLQQELDSVNQDLEKSKQKLQQEIAELKTLQKISTAQNKELATSTSIDEVWNDYKDWLTSKEYTKQDLKQN